MSIIIPANTLAAGGFDVDNSLRFNDGSSDYLNRTQGTPTNADKFTLSVWVKRCGLTTNDYHYIASFDGGSNPREHIRFNDGTDQLTWYFRDGSGTASDLTTNRLFRDVSAWYHILCVYDSTQGTNSNRQKIYVNGVQETSFSSSGYVAQNTDSNLNTNSNNIKIGALGVSSPNAGFFDGYMAEYVFIDGSALAPDQFGEFDEDSGIWKPIDVSGLTFGTNGFYLDFENSGALGNDAAGSNNFTVNNLTATDQSTDTCTNNFATLNPLQNLGSNIAYSDGNLTITPGTSDYKTTASTIAVGSGKWYAEFKAVSGHNGSTDVSIGIVGADTFLASTGSKAMSAYTNAFSYGSGGLVKQYNGSTIRTDATYTNGDIIGIAVDMDNLKLYWSKNGTFQNSGNPTSGSTGTGAIAITAGQPYYICAATISSGGVKVFSANFGSPPYANSSSAADGNGFGDFEYAPPSGYFSLNTKNLAEYG